MVAVEGVYWLTVLCYLDAQLALILVLAKACRDWLESYGRALRLSQFVLLVSLTRPNTGIGLLDVRLNISQGRLLHLCHTLFDLKV